MPSRRRTLSLGRRGRRALAVAVSVVVAGGALAVPAAAQAPPSPEAPTTAVGPAPNPTGEPGPTAPLTPTGDLNPAADRVSPADQLLILADTLALAPEDPPPSPDDVFVAVGETERAAVDAATVRLDAATGADEARRDALVAAGALQDAQADADAAVARRDRARAALATERRRLSELTVRAYVTGGDDDSEGLGALLDGDTTDAAGGRAVIFEQVIQRQQEVVDEARAEVDTARRAMTAVAKRLDAARARSTERDQEARHRAQIEDQAQRALDVAEVARLKAATALRAGPSGLAVPDGVAIIGLPRLSAEDLATWFAASPYRAAVPTPIEDYARWFIDEGAAEGIRGDIAFAQAVLETGGFTNSDSVFANNFSGIGHCDTCATGWTFSTPQMGVRAQIQLLKSYAVARPRYVNPLVDRRLRGPAGCCDIWGDLTTVWATDPGYGPKVMALYSAMVDHALRRRAGGVGFAPVPDAGPVPNP